jgi:conjugative relaxase-like TrwC/TraI family protein
MLSVASMSGGQGHYYAGLAREDYYLAGGEPPGIWMGKGAQTLGFAGIIDREAFLDIFDGFQNGEALVQGAGSERHRPGWDLTFSAPKSVSVIWSQADKETALEIRAAQASAVEKAVAYLEDEAVWTRRGKAGLEHQKCAAVVAAFEHGTSRAQDPQLHTHALLLNIGVRDDGTTGTLETHSLYLHKMAAGAIYRAELAHQLERRLGFEIERDKSSFAVKGVSKELVEEFSKRRKEIEASLKERRLATSRAAEIAALDTRGKKAHIAREELKERWRAVGREHGWSTEQAERLVKERRRTFDPSYALERVAQVALEKMMLGRSYFTERELTRTVAEEAQALGGGADEVRAAVKVHLSGSPEIVRLGLRYREPIFTTKTMLAFEQDLLQRVEKSREHSWKGASEAVVNWFGKASVRSRRRRFGTSPKKPARLQPSPEWPAPARPTCLKPLAQYWRCRDTESWAQRLPERPLGASKRVLRLKAQPSQASFGVSIRGRRSSTRKRCLWSTRREWLARRRCIGSCARPNGAAQSSSLSATRSSFSPLRREGHFRRYRASLAPWSLPTSSGSETSGNGKP